MVGYPLYTKAMIMFRLGMAWKTWLVFRVPLFGAKWMVLTISQHLPIRSNLLILFGMVCICEFILFCLLVFGTEPQNPCSHDESMCSIIWHHERLNQYIP